MKTLELTEEHKSKLLEMCNKLFPESNWCMSTQNGTCGIHSSKIDQIFVYEGSNPYNFPVSIIHWFEFCMTHLAEKILTQDEQLNDFLLTFNVDLHPIAYLYEEFKNLEL